jgi:hypothetical protein
LTWAGSGTAGASLIDVRRLGGGTSLVAVDLEDSVQMLLELAPTPFAYPFSKEALSASEGIVMLGSPQRELREFALVSVRRTVYPWLAPRASRKRGQSCLRFAPRASADPLAYLVWFARPSLLVRDR